MTHRTRHIQTRAPVELLRFPILFPDSAPTHCWPSTLHPENTPHGAPTVVTAIVTQRMCHLFVSKTSLISNSCD